MDFDLNDIISEFIRKEIAWKKIELVRAVLSVSTKSKNGYFISRANMKKIALKFGYGDLIDENFKVEILEEVLNGS